MPVRGLLILAVLLGSSFVPITSVAAHGMGFPHDVAACTTGSAEFSGQYAVAVGASGGGSAYKAVRGEATVVDLLPCYNPVSGNGGWSLVNVANARRYTGTGGFVQLGYAKQTCASGGCQDDFVSQQVDFWFTKYDNRDGEIHTANWVNDLDGNTADHDYPVVGDKYRFTISELEGPNRWRYCVQVLSSATYIQNRSDCHNEPRTSSDYFDESSWAIEIYNDASAVGHREPGSDIDIIPMQYLNWNGSVYTTITGEDATCSWYGDAEPTSTDCFETSSTGTTSVFDAWTISHS